MANCCAKRTVRTVDPWVTGSPAPMRPFPASTASNGADLARFLGDNQVRVQFPQDVAVNPVARIDVGQGLLNDRVNSPAVQSGKPQPGKANARLSPNPCRLIASVGNPP